MSRISNVVDNFLEEYACSQAILSEYCELFNLNRDTAIKITAGFSGGMRAAKRQDLLRTICPKLVRSSAELSDIMLEES
ncbi:MAG: hypothetical protein Q7J15_03095 [Candidatus Desulfaltia sp.]|nr:hypothetical protein [Candidatus Desulfaltia sp.]